MKVRFLGPIDRVTGSCSQLSDPERKFEALVDCGLVQGEVGDDDWNSGKWPFEPAKLTHVFLTHAHVDHCGLIPLLYKRGYRGSVYCTRETANLAALVLRDAVSHGAPYTLEDVERVRFHEPALDAARHKWAPVHDDIFIKWYRSGHIYGAVSLSIYVGPPHSSEQRGIVFSGDLGALEDGGEQLTLNRARETPYAVDYAVIESTYGDRLRPPEGETREARLDGLRTELRRAAEGGALIVPCFAIDRTQQVLLDVHEVLRRDTLGAGELRSISLLLHAPLAVRVNAIYAEAARRKFTSSKEKTRPWWLGKGLFHQLELDPYDAAHERAVEAWVRRCLGQEPLPGDAEFLRRHVPGAAPRLEVVAGATPRKLTPGTVLVTGGGMCDGGAIHPYLARNLSRPDVTVAFTGYLSGGTVGARLLDLARVPAADRERQSDAITLTTGTGAKLDVPVAAIRARFTRLGGYSGHADQASLIRWVFGSMAREKRPVGRRVFVQHGQAQARKALAKELNAEAARLGVDPFEAETPNAVDWFDLNTGAWDTTESRRLERARLRARLEELDRLDGSS